MDSPRTGGNGNGSASGAPAPPSDVVIDCNIRELFYGEFKAVRDTAIPVKRHTITAFSSWRHRARHRRGRRHTYGHTRAADIASFLKPARSAPSRPPRRRPAR